MADTGLDGRVRHLLTEGELGVVLRQELRSHQICAVRARKGSDQLLLVAQAQRRNHEFSPERCEASSRIGIEVTRQCTNPVAIAFEKRRDHAAALLAGGANDRD